MLILLLALGVVSATLLSTATAQNPNATPADRQRALDYYYRGRDHLDADRSVMAALFFEQAVNADATFAPAQFAYARLLTEISTEYEIALGCVQAGLAHDRTNLDALLLGVRLARITGDQPLAFGYALDAFNAHGARSEILLELGTAAYDADELDVAHDAYTRRLAAQPGDSESRYNLARIAFRRWHSASIGDDEVSERTWRNTFLDWAEQLLDTNLPLAPSWWRAEIFGNAMRICLELRDPPGAAMWAERMADADPSMNNRLQASLLKRVDAGEARIAVRDLSPILGLIDFTGARNPTRHLSDIRAKLSALETNGAIVPELHAVAASLAHQLDEYPDVLDHCASFGELWPIVAEFHLLRARAAVRMAADLEENGDIEARDAVLQLALESYTAMAERDPSSVEFATYVQWIPASVAGEVPTLALNVYWLGWQLLGDPDGGKDALDMLGFALQLAPDWRPALELFAEAAHRERAYAQAVPAYQRALARALWPRVDHDNSGTLNETELAANPQLGALAALDANGDGGVTLDEFVSRHVFTALDFGADRAAFASNTAGDREILRSLRGLAVALILSANETSGHVAAVALCESLQTILDDIESRTLAELARDLRDGKVAPTAFRHYWHSRFASTAAELARELKAALGIQPTLFEALDSSARVMLREAEQFRRDNAPNAANLRRFEQMLRDADKAFEAAFTNARNDAQRAHAAGGRQLVAMADGDEGKALSHAEAALGFDPTLVDTRYLYAQQLRISGAAFAAHREIVDVLRRSPHYDGFQPTDAARFSLRIPADPAATGNRDVPRAVGLPVFPPAGTKLAYTVNCVVISKLAVAQLQRPRFRFECEVLPTPDGEPTDPGIATLRITVAWVRDFVADRGMITGSSFTATISNLLGLIDVDWGAPPPEKQILLEAMLGLVGPAFAELWIGTPDARPRAVGDAWRMPAAQFLQRGGPLDADLDKNIGISRSESAHWIDTIEGTGAAQRVTLIRREKSWSPFEDPLRNVTATKTFDTGLQRATSATIAFTTLVQDQLARLSDWVETSSTTTIHEE